MYNRAIVLLIVYSCCDAYIPTHPTLLVPVSHGVGALKRTDVSNPFGVHRPGAFFVASAALRVQTVFGSQSERNHSDQRFATPLCFRSPAPHTRSALKCGTLVGISIEARRRTPDLDYPSSTCTPNQTGRRPVTRPGLRSREVPAPPARRGLALQIWGTTTTARRRSALRQRRHGALTSLS
ncbi:hypothetical protein C8Q76DRAFT_38218 [Earliella scabrosa]|nr:hypothetical protein C8Q76DRAFT_38218 [Earliella scabrosa]